MTRTASKAKLPNSSVTATRSWRRICAAGSSPGDITPSSFTTTAGRTHTTATTPCGGSPAGRGATARSAARAAQVHAPAVFIGGWYDIFLQGTINSFVTIHNHGGVGSRGRCRLILAPIGHGTMTELKYPANASKLPKCGDNVAWFDSMLKGLTNGVGEEKPVHYYVMGDPSDNSAPAHYLR